MDPSFGAGRLPNMNGSQDLFSKCPLCGASLMRHDMGVNSHLRMHIRRGELPPAEERELRLKLLNRTWVIPPKEPR